MGVKIIAWKEGSQYRAAFPGRQHHYVIGTTLIETVGRLVIARGRKHGIEIDLSGTPSNNDHTTAEDGP